jgi:site-specific recombinase XerD
MDTTDVAERGRREARAPHGETAVQGRGASGDDADVLHVRATTITDLLNQGVPLEDVQQLTGHADPRTTRVHDRRRREVTRNIVERISIKMRTTP